jgi:hypothetical protein
MGGQARHFQDGVGSDPPGMGVGVNRRSPLGDPMATKDPYWGYYRVGGCPGHP